MFLAKLLRVMNQIPLEKNRYWREPLAESVSMPPVGVSELLISYAEEIRPDQSSLIDSGKARTELSDTRSNNESLDDDSSVVLGPMHQKPCATDARGVARNNLQSENG